MRLFIAMATSPAVDEAVDRVLHGALAGADARRVPSADRHVTVRFLGEMDDPGAPGDAVRRAAAACAPPVLVVRGPLDRMTATALVLPVGGAEPVAAAVDRELGAPATPFRGHLTVARLRRSARTPPPPAAGPLEEIRWTPPALLLVESDLRGRPRYRTVVDAPWGA